jgi:hypothetical protein
MPLNFTQIFTQYGRFVYWCNQWLTYQSVDLLANTTGAADQILSQYETQRFLVIGVQQQMQGQASTMASWVSQSVNALIPTFQNLQQALNAPNNSINTIMPLFIQAMIEDSQTVQANTITAAAITAEGSNVGNGQLVVSINNAAGIPDERILNETVAVVCTQDKYTGAQSGGESWSITGWPQQSASTGPYVPQGNGNGPTMRTANNSNIITNGGFETWSSNLPAGWTLVAGTAGTNIVQSATAHRGSSSLELAGDGSTTTIGITQPISGVTQKIYGLGVFLRKAGTVSSGSTLTISISGSGISTVNLFNADPSTLTTSYVLHSAFLSLTDVIPANLAVNISWTSANSAGGSAQILIDDYVLVLTTNFGFEQYVMYAGSTDFQQGDEFSVVSANNNDGVFQTFNCRFFGYALPSTNSSAGPTISDSLAT